MELAGGVGKAGDPAGGAHGPVEMEIDLASTERARTILQVQGLPVQTAGRYYFRIELQNEGETEWRKAVEIPLTVDFEAEKEKQEV